MRLKGSKGVLPLVAIVALWTAPALARGPADDRIVLDLAREGWVETKTAEVVLAVNATLKQEESANVRQTILAALQKLSPDADWRITTFNRNADRSGLDSWYVEAQARIDDTGLDGMRAAADKASQPGMTITVNAINFTPTLAEVEATRAALRQAIYKDAQAELDRVNAAFPDAHYRINLVNFTGRAVAPVPQPQFMARADAVAAAPKAIAVEDRIQLQATVVLAAGEAAKEGGE